MSPSPGLATEDRLSHINAMSKDEARSPETTHIYLDRRVEPNRSLTRRGMFVVLAIVAAFNLFTTVFMLVIRAYPAPIFLGADMAAISLAFLAMDRRHLHRIEHIRISSHRVEVLRRTKGQEGPVWSTAPGFTRIEVDRSDQDRPVVRLASAGRTLEIAAELGAEGRTRLAADLDDAIRAARSERYPL